MNSINLASDLGEVVIIDERTYAFGSADNVRQYAQEVRLQPVYDSTSAHGVFLRGEPMVVFGAPGGCSAVHEHSALVRNAKLYLAVGNSMVCFALDQRKLIWASVVDDATCFGVYFEPQRNALISHGELDVARVDDNGNILWRSSGADIFSEDFTLEQEYIVVTDFSRREYRMCYESGDLATGRIL